MNSRKLLKTTFQNKKEIVSVVFDGINDYDLFINKGKRCIKSVNIVKVLINHAVTNKKY